MQEIYCIVKVIKFGDGDEPNLCRLKKQMLIPHLFLTGLISLKAHPIFFLLKRKRKMSYIESPHSKSFMIRAGTRCTLYKFTCTVQSGLPSVSCRPSNKCSQNYHSNKCNKCSINNKHNDLVKPLMAGLDIYLLRHVLLPYLTPAQPKPV